VLFARTVIVEKVITRGGSVPRKNLREKKRMELKCIRFLEVSTSIKRKGAKTRNRAYQAQHKQKSKKEGSRNRLERKIEEEPFFQE